MLMMEWSCEICTYVNSAGVALCDMCQSPAPPPPEEEVKIEKV